MRVKIIIIINENAELCVCCCQGVKIFTVFCNRPYNLLNVIFVKEHGNKPDGKVLNYLLQLEAGSQSHTLRRYELFNMVCPNGIMETFDVIRRGIQVNTPPETFAVAVSILPSFFIGDLIESNANLNSSFEDGEFAVHAALRVNSLSKFDRIVANNQTCLSLEWRGLTPIETAIVYYLSGNAISKVMEILENETNESLFTIAEYV